jgi:hypothetical protein
LREGSALCGTSQLTTVLKHAAYFASPVRHNSIPYFPQFSIQRIASLDLYSWIMWRFHGECAVIREMLGALNAIAEGKVKGRECRNRYAVEAATSEAFRKLVYRK